MSRTSDDVSLTFSREKEIKYVRRFEEGYDLPDPRYKAWLSIHHPSAVSFEEPNCTSQTGFSPQTEVVTPSQSMSTMSNQSLPSHVGLVELRRIKLSTLPGVETSPEPVSTLLDQSTPNHLTMRPGQLTDQSPVSMPTITLLEPTSITPDSSGVGLSTKTTPRRSPLSDLVNIPTVQPKKTGCARVLTSSECLKTFKEKEEKKRLAAEEKQRRKEERELKKKQKDEEMKRKSELKAQKAAEREAKQQQKQSRQ